VRFRHEAAVWHVVRTERKSNLILLRASFDLVRSTRLSELPALPIFSDRLSIFGLRA
jgi:hypothetical protein